MGHKTPIKSLRNDCITTTPTDCDWSEGYGETWEYHVASECGDCGETVFGAHGECQHRDLDHESECMGYVNEDGPMMNYYYEIPRPRDLDEACKSIAHLPLCIVEFTGGPNEGTYALALTGGGMNLAWEICEAFMQLGYLPPVHFAALPAMCGRGASRRDAWIMAGCRKSARIASVWALGALSAIKRARDFGREYANRPQVRNPFQPSAE